MNGVYTLVFVESSRAASHGKHFVVTTESVNTFDHNSG